MKVNGQHYRSIWYDHQIEKVKIIDQRYLPHEFKIKSLNSLKDFGNAILEMEVRGAPLIGATAAFGVAEQMKYDSSNDSLEETCQYLNNTRPTAINLMWATNRCKEFLAPLAKEKRPEAALNLAQEICNEDIEINQRIGTFGVKLIDELAKNKTDGTPVRILTHCNAGWLATVDWGTATSPMYHAHDEGIPIHVWVDETRPRNQGALTSWELNSHGISNNYITDNAGGHLMQHSLVDMVIVGTDRTTAQGDVCNKIGTYLKALAAKDNNIPFYVALPSPTIDWTVKDGIQEIPIEERDQTEVTHISGLHPTLGTSKVQVSPLETKAINPSFDVTPARLVTGLITERGLCKASEEGLRSLFPNTAEKGFSK